MIRIGFPLLIGALIAGTICSKTLSARIVFGVLLLFFYALEWAIHVEAKKCGL